MAELRYFFRMRWVELLIAGVWLQSVVSAAFTGSLVVLALTALGGLVCLFLIFWAIGWVQRRRSPTYGVGEAFEVSRDAMVFTVGGQKDTLAFVVEGQTLGWLGLICSRKTEPQADAISLASGLDPDRIQKEIVDPWNIVEVRTKTALVLDWLRRRGVEPARTAVDITGGTSIMTAGAFSVASERQVDTQYVRSDYGIDNKRIPGTERAVFVARYA